MTYLGVHNCIDIEDKSLLPSLCQREELPLFGKEGRGEIFRRVTTDLNPAIIDPNVFGSRRRGAPPCTLFSNVRWYTLSQGVPPYAPTKPEPYRSTKPASTLFSTILIALCGSLLFFFS